MGVKRGLVGFGVAVAVVAAFVALSIAEESHARSELAPPEGLQTMAELRSHLPPATRLQQIENEGKRYTVWWVPHRTSYLWLPSGAPAYVFDAEDRLVMWTHETGDGDEVARFIESSSTTG